MTKWLIVLVVLAYAALPFDLFPDAMGGWGRLDDILLAGLLGYLYFRRAKQASNASQKKAHQESAWREGRSGSSSSKGKDAQGDKREDPHAILGVDRGASQEDIRAAYRRLAALYHPDRHTHLGDEFRSLAEKKFKAIQSAYDALRDR